MYVGKALDKRWLDGDRVELWETGKLTASQRKLLRNGSARLREISTWEMGVDYRIRLF